MKISGTGVELGGYRSTCFIRTGQHALIPKTLDQLNKEQKLRECFSTRGAQPNAGLAASSRIPLQIRLHVSRPCLERQVEMPLLLR
jgi:hypothetical protein